jgi:hypothetical protein
MTHRFGLIIMFGLLLMSPQLVAAGEPRYLVLDSKVPVDEQTHPVWLNNSQVIFIGYEPDPANPPKQVGLAWEIPRGVYVWDLEKGTAARDHRWDGTANWCVSGEFRSFHRLRPGTEKTYDLVQGEAGEEQVLSLPAKHWSNRISCRYYTSLPYWRIEGEKNQSFPLLEKHGYLDFGIPVWVDPSRKPTAIVLYRSDSKNGIELPLKGRQVQFQVTYSEFADAYLLKGEQRTSDAIPVWLLKPDGTIAKVLKPTGKPWEKIGWGHFYLTKKGLLLTGGRGAYGSVGTTGGYLLEKDKPKRIIAGFVRNAAVSPDGCKLVFVHSLHSQAEADSIKALREGRPGTRTLKVIDLCKGEKTGAGQRTEVYERMVA